MGARRLAAVIVVVSVALGNAGCSKKSQPVRESTGASAVPTPPRPKILTKEPEYVRLLNPPTGDDFVKAYSSSYNEKVAEINAKTSSITDGDLRKQAFDDEWSKVDREAFRAEANGKFRATLLACLKGHRADWFEVGHVDYSSYSKSLEVKSVAAAPISFSSLSFPVELAAMDKVYSQFDAITKESVRQKAEDSIQTYKRNFGNGGWMEGVGYYGPPTLNEAMRSAQKETREERLIVVAQGDLVTQRIDKLMLVDYDSETVFLELDPHISALNEVTWKFPSDEILGSKDALVSLYGNYDEQLNSAKLEFDNLAPKEFEEYRNGRVQVFFRTNYEENGQAKLFLLTSAVPTDPAFGDFSCHACRPLIGAAIYVKSDGIWKLEASERYLMTGQGFGKTPDAHLVQIGPNRHGLRLAVADRAQGSEVDTQTIISSLGNRIVRVLEQVTLDDNCGFNEADCSRTEAKIDFVQGKNPECFDISVISKSIRTTSSGTVQSGEVAKLYKFVTGEYRPADSSALSTEGTTKQPIGAVMKVQTSSIAPR